MKKYLIILIALILNQFTYGQLYKPSIPAAGGAIVSDSLSLKYLASDSSNIWGSYLSFNNSPLGNSTRSYDNLALGYGSLRAINGFTQANNGNICLGKLSGYLQYDNVSINNCIYLGYESGGYDYNYIGVLQNNYDIAIGYNAGLDLFSQSGTPSNNNNFIGFSCGVSFGYGSNNNFIGTNNGYNSGTNSQLNNILGYTNFQYCVGSSNNNIVGNNIANHTSFNQHLNNCTLLGDGLYMPLTAYNGAFIVSSGAYYSGKNFIFGDMTTANFNLKANLNIDSSGLSLRYHSLPGLTNRTAGFDSVLLANTVDTVFTTAYDSSSIVNITPIQNGAGTIINIAYDRQNSKPGQYFIVRVNALTSNELFNWFLIKVY